MRRFGHRMIEQLTRPEALQQIRMVISACAKFPTLGRAFFEAGPCYGADRFAEILRGFAERGDLTLDDPRAAAGHYLDMLHGAAVKPALFCVEDSANPAAASAAVEGALRVFMAAYKTRR